MARARNIKPSFFDNDELAENSPLGRLLFIGLWTLCDYRGNLEWRPKRIKKQILAYDDCDVDKLAINLDKSGFVRFYSDGDRIYLNIVNFNKHQNPHKNERDKGSEIPQITKEMRQVVDLKELTINRGKSGLNHDNSDSNPADSLILIPDSLNLNPEPSATRLDYDRIKEIFNSNLTKASSVIKLTDKRKKLVKKLFDEFDLDYDKFANYLTFLNNHPNAQWMFEERPKNDGSGQSWQPQKFEYFVSERCFLNAKENL